MTGLRLESGWLRNFRALSRYGKGLGCFRHKPRSIHEANTNQQNGVLKHTIERYNNIKALGWFPGQDEKS